MILVDLMRYADYRERHRSDECRCISNADDINQRLSVLEDKINRFAEMLLVIGYKREEK